MIKFLHALLQQDTKVQLDYLVHPLPDTVFADCLSQWAWVTDYQSLHGKFPSWHLFQHKFKVRLAKPVTESFDDLRQMAHDQALYEQMARLIEQARRGIEQGQQMTNVAAGFRQGAEQLIQDTHNTEEVDMFADTQCVLRGYHQRRHGESDAVTDPVIWPRINKELQYLVPGNYCLLTARPNIGKTWVLAALADHYVRNGHRVLFHTMEMPVPSILERITCLSAKLSYPQFRNGTLSVRDLRRWTWWRKKVAPGYSLKVMGGNMGTEGTLALLRTACRRYNPKIVCVDGAYLLADLEGRGNNQTQALTKVSNLLRRFAITEQVVLWATIQLNREAEGDKGNTSSNRSLGVLYGSDSWGQDADVVLALEGERGTPLRQLVPLKLRECLGNSAAIAFDLSPPAFVEVAGDVQTAEGDYISPIID